MEESPPEPLPSPTPPPRLRIHHFIIWMAALAVMLTIHNKDFEDSTAFSAFTFQAIIERLLIAVALATLGLGIYWRWRGCEFFTAVGHWLLLAIAIDFFSKAISAAQINYLWQSHPIDDPYNYERFRYINKLIMYCNFFEWLAKSVVLFFAGHIAAGTKQWKLFCYLMSSCYFIASFVTAISYLLAGPDALPGFIPLPLGLSLLISSWLLLCVIAIGNDFETSTSRHWSHHCGVITWITLWASTAVSSAFQFLNQ